MSDLDRNRAQSLMRASNIDALLLFQPETFTYVTGAPAGVASMWRRGGGAVALVPSDSTAPVTAIVGDLHADIMHRLAPDVAVREHRIWVDTVDLAGPPHDGRATPEIVEDGYRRRSSGSGPFPPRPTTYDLAVVFRLIAETLGDFGLSKARVGVDLEFLPAADYFALIAALPTLTIADGSPVVRQLRAIKSPAEIERLRRACALAEAGLLALTSGIAEGQSRTAVARLWRDGVAKAVTDRGTTDLTGQWDYVSVGPDPWGSEGTVVPGAIIKADVGCLIAGYSSDTARSYSFGRPDRIARDIHAALLDSFEAGLAAIRPGVWLREVYAVIARTMERAGYSGYRRGHFGHSLGASVGSEEWPFIAADSDAIAESGMVLALETPFYATGIGALTIEDQLLVTGSGIDVMTTIPRSLTELG